jgi:formamidopyrimidine-DNA glycosylase
MPELPEAETIARELDAALAGEPLGRVVVRRQDMVHGDPRPLARSLRNRRVVRVSRRAKRVVLELEPKAELVFRLGMSGRVTVCSSDAPLERHTHLRIAFGNRTDAKMREIRFCDPRRFGGVWCLAGGAAWVGKSLGDVGPEPLPMRPAQFRAILDRRRQLKALLMDQQMIAGLGNIYCDESLHAAGLHPLRLSHTLDAAESGLLLRSIKSTLRRAIKSNGSTLSDYFRTNGESGSFQARHRVYGREGEPCKGCGAGVLRIVAAGRSTFFCPVCQPGQP